MEELITTGDLADSIGSEEATQVVGEVKEEILDKGLTDPDEIGDAVDKIAEKHDVTLTDDQKQQLVSLMEKISQYDYDLDSIKDTLNNLSGKVGVSNCDISTDELCHSTPPANSMLSVIR